ncbi:MAG: DUF4065 domain-containing protein [Anaerolineae bacterium]|nr:DUF4065 domain-containing protein [Anaerolineae bacterium]
MNVVIQPEYVLAKYPNKVITPLKLQKLLYYVKVWSLIAGKPLYAGQFHRWSYGPVDQVVYHNYKVYGQGPIPVPSNPPIIIDSEAKALADFILEAYIIFSAYDLSAMTHREQPWQNTPNGEIISDTVILDYYCNHPFARNFNPFDPDGKPFYAVQSDAWHAFTMDMVKEEAEQYHSYESYSEYKQQVKAAQKDVQQIFDKLV